MHVPCAHLAMVHCTAVGSNAWPSALHVAVGAHAHGGAGGDIGEDNVLTKALHVVTCRHSVSCDITCLIHGRPVEQAFMQASAQLAQQKVWHG